MEKRIAQLEQQLKGLTIGVKTKDLSLATSIREWNGQSQAKPVTEFLAQVEQCARVSNWSEEDVVNIIKAKLTGEARQFVDGRDQLTNDNVRYEVLKAALVDRFTEKLPVRYHYNLLHEATQGKEESPIQFLDRCRALSTKTVRKSEDPTVQRILKEEAEFRLLTNFIYGMRGEAGRELRIRNPETLDQALNIATVVYNAKRMEPHRKDHDTLTVKTERKSYTSPKGYRPPWDQRSQPQGSPVRRSKERRDANRDWVRPPVKCFSCGRQGHIARDCEARRKPTIQREQSSPN
ncbi:uncharacterized protein LOC111865092 [Cryptotermes secundus]|uniref:uncharacterized protein LOC111865092 n=1 Tax=Cryptotermes secundus TaxID=105785 RepID=UPI000CD7BFDD|nr:uncharacterized protein LOC111865092 [Cryptotermes secundus]